MYVIGVMKNSQLDHVYAQVFWSLEDANFAKASMGEDTVVLEILTPRVSSASLQQD